MHLKKQSHISVSVSGITQQWVKKIKYSLITCHLC